MANPNTTAVETLHAIQRNHRNMVVGVLTSVYREEAQIAAGTHPAFTKDGSTLTLAQYLDTLDAPDKAAMDAGIPAIAAFLAAFGVTV